MKFSTIYLTAIAMASSGIASALPKELNSEVVTFEAATAGGAAQCVKAGKYCGRVLHDCGKFCYNVSQ